MAPSKYEKLSRREREIMDLVYRMGEATAGEVRKGLAEPPGYSAVRATLRILEEKGHLKHRRDGRRYVFSPTVSAKTVRRSAMTKLVKTFFDGSPEQAVAALLDMSAKDLSAEELARIGEMIERAKKEGR
jgi:predicted transcriptional regulator